MRLHERLDTVLTTSFTVLPTTLLLLAACPPAFADTVGPVVESGLVGDVADAPESLAVVVLATLAGAVAGSFCSAVARMPSYRTVRRASRRLLTVT